MVAFGYAFEEVRISLLRFIKGSFYNQMSIVLFSCSSRANDHFLRHKKNPPSFGKGEFGLVCEVDAKGENGFPLDFALVIPEAVRKA